MHVLHTFANNTTVPYLTWFTDRAVAEGAPRYSFIIMHRERPKMMDEMRAKGFEVVWIPYDDGKRKRGGSPGGSPGFIWPGAFPSGWRRPARCRGRSIC